MIADALSRPLRTEAQAQIDRQTIADRTELYERMLSYDPMRAGFLARCSWEQRWGHYFNHMNHAPTWAPPAHLMELIASASLHPEVSAETWRLLADEMTDWSVVIADLVDSATTPLQREKAEGEVDVLKRRVARAREFERVLRAENARRAA